MRDQRVHQALGGQLCQGDVNQRSSFYLLFLFHSNCLIFVFLPRSLSKLLFPSSFLSLLSAILPCLFLCLLFGFSTSTPFLFFNFLFQNFDRIPSDSGRKADFMGQIYGITKGPLPLESTHLLTAEWPLSPDKRFPLPLGRVGGELTSSPPQSPT